MIDTLVMVGQLVLALSILVGVHELGHLLSAKIFGMRVEQFSIGFPPKIWGFKKGDTTYSIGSIPLGGYVKISGMIDESLDTAQMSSEPMPWEFRSKPAWQRLIVMLGGIIVNILTGILIFIVLTYKFGESYISRDEVNKYGIVVYELGEMIGFRTGDKIVKINGEDFEKFSDVTSPELLLESNSYYTVERDGQRIDLPIPANFIEAFSDRRASLRFVEPRIPFRVGELSKGRGAELGGLQEGDRILSVNGEPVAFFHELRPLLGRHAGRKVEVLVDRPAESGAGASEELMLQIPIAYDSTMGFMAEYLIEQERIDYSLAQAIPIGTGRAFSVVWVNIVAFGKIFKGELSPTKSLRGPLGIMKTFGVTWDWVRFWTLTGLISMVLAFMNFLPIPALDGGHVMFLMYEIVSGRKPSDKFLENAQKVGMALLLVLMIFVFFNDIIQEFF
jgi:regulator of sigma E protease